MKVALLSDIHGNYLALEAVLKEIKNENISTLLICGDFVGYYYRVSKVLSLLTSFNVIACKGNHENLFEEWLTGSCDIKTKLLEKYGKSFKRAEETLTSEQKQWLLNLEHPVFWESEQKRFCLSHGSPWDINLYLYENTIDRYKDDFDELALLYDVVIIGHSHYQFTKKMGSLHVISPGSLGQPRSGQFSLPSTMTRAQWASMDLKSMAVELKTTLYDSSPLMDEIKAYDPDISYLKKVLQRH